MKHFASLALFTLFFAPTAQAQTGPIPAKATPPAVAASAPVAQVPSEAETFKAQLEGIIENQKVMSEKNGCKLITKGDIKVEKATGYYAFTLPSITYVNARGARSEIGMLAINAVPDADNVNWKVSLAIPTPIKRFGPDNKELVRTEIGSQNVAGVWNTKLGRFTKLDANFKNLTQNFMVEKNLVTVESIGVTARMAETVPGIWSGPVNVVATNITAYNSMMDYKDMWPKMTLTTSLSSNASDKPLTKEDIVKRSQDGYSDYYNLISLFAGEPKKMRAAVTGFDAAVARMQKSMLTVKQEIRSAFLQANLLMAGINAIGKKDPAQPDVRIYDAVFSNGQVTVNDVPIDTLVSQ